VDAWDAEQEIAAWQPSRTYLPADDGIATDGR
jgi:hypothetical protein